MRIVLCVAVLVIAGCSNAEPIKSSSGEKDDTYSGMLRVGTFENRGHWFIACGTGQGNGGMALLHHPACPCQAKAEAPDGIR